MKFSTIAIAGGKNPDEAIGSLSIPIYQTTAFVFPNAKVAADRFQGKAKGFIYSRLGNPTQQAFEHIMALLEEGEAALATSSGQAAMAVTLMGLLKSGDHLICGRTVYGCTYSFIKDYLEERFGIEVSLIDTSDIELVKKTIKINTKVIFIETPTNPTLEVSDIKKIAFLANKFKIKLVVDNTFLTPYFQKPLKLGASVVVHSCTKYISGHGDTMAGVIVGAKKIIKPLYESTLKDHGCIIAPFNAWLCLRGIETLAIRMEQHQKNAMAIAKFLFKHPKVGSVKYLGLSSHSHYKINKKQSTGYGAVITFKTKGGNSGAYRFLDNVGICRLAVSLGAANTLICHPASTTHSIIPKQKLNRMGISNNLIRLSVGLEHYEDIINDLKEALKYV